MVEADDGVVRGHEGVDEALARPGVTASAPKALAVDENVPWTKQQDARRAVGREAHLRERVDRLATRRASRPVTWTSPVRTPDSRCSTTLPTTTGAAKRSTMAWRAPWARSPSSPRSASGRAAPSARDRGGGRRGRSGWTESAKDTVRGPGSIDRRALGRHRRAGARSRRRRARAGRPRPRRPARRRRASPCRARLAGARPPRSRPRCGVRSIRSTTTKSLGAQGLDERRPLGRAPVPPPGGHGRARSVAG